MRVCTRCKTKRHERDFRVHVRADLPAPYTSKVCKVCERATNKAHAEKPETRRRKRAYHIATRYNLTPEQWQQKLTEQGGGCAICRKPLTRPFTDHNHTTGQVRGLLCGPCNMWLGHIRETLDVVQRAQKYLEFYNGK